MGTRGCVAVGTPDNWIGVYNHWDSYPAGLGREVWNEWKQNPNLPEDLLKFDDWRSYLNGGICEYCGKKRGQPHSILVNEYTLKPGGDPDALYHDHNDEDPTKHHLTSEKSDPLFIEWVYVLDPGRNKLHILSNVAKPNYERSKPNHNPSKDNDGYWDYGHCAYRHEPCRTLDLETDEPDWDKLENQIAQEMWPDQL